MGGIMPDDVVQMKIGKHRYGIIGFNAASRSLANRYGPLSDQEIKEALMEEMGKKNYIPENVRQEYEQAFFRAFKAFVGEPVPEPEPTTGIEIKVLGRGCTRCRQMEQDMMNIVSEMNIEADIEHVSDIVEIARYGVLGLPALVINGKVKTAGNLPPKSKIMEWISSAQKASQNQAFG
jgi:small redox-active disulfide protein 2